MEKEGSTEQRILEVAKNVFLEKGLAGARMQDIADKAGINKALLHYYFRSKEKLFDAIFQEIVSQFFPKVMGILDSEASLFDKIRRFCEVYIELGIQTPYLPSFLLIEINKDPKAVLAKITKHKKPSFDIIIHQIQDDIKKKRIKKTEPMSLLVNMLSLCMFPFIAKPMIQTVFRLDNEVFRKIMEERKKEVAEMMIASIKT